MQKGGGASHTPREVAHREEKDQGHVSERIWEYWAEGPISVLATYFPLYHTGGTGVPSLL